jgi:macrodomain Ter protein organizer (MatP/YcbG family)
MRKEHNMGRAATNNVKVSINLPSKTYLKLKCIAEDNETTLTAVIQSIIAESLRSENKPSNTIEDSSIKEMNAKLDEILVKLGRLV